MNLIQLIACIGLITGCFVLLHISPMDFTEGVFRRITSKPKSIRSEVNESTRRKKKSFLRREIEETQTILRMTGRAAKFPMVCAPSGAARGCWGRLRPDAGQPLPGAGAGGGHDVRAVLVYPSDRKSLQKEHRR